MSSAGSLFVEILPSIKGINEAIRAEITAPATESATKAGAAIGDGIATGTRDGAVKAGESIRTAIVGSAKSAATEANLAMKSVGAGMSASVQAEMKKAEDAVVSSAQRMAAARNMEADAAGKVRIAEENLATVRAKETATATQIAAAEERLAKAQRDQALAAENSSVASKKLGESQAGMAAASAKTAEAEKAVAKGSVESNLAMSRSKAVMADLSSTTGGLMSKFSAMGPLIGVAIVGALGVSAVKAAMSFQQSQERLVTTAGELQKNLKGVSDGVLSLAGQVGYSAQEISTGMYTVESAGYHGANGLTIMKAAAEGAKEENASLTTVTDAVTSSMRDYHMPASQAALVTSRLVTAVGDGKTNFEQFTGALSAVLPIASATHVRMSEVLGDLSSMTLHGMSAEQASQNLATAIRSLANPTLAMTKELAALGINSADLSKNLGTKGVQGTMEEVATAILQHMGPAGTTLLNSLNQSKQAAADAAAMFAKLPPAALKVAKAYQDGTLSYKSFRKEAGGLSADQANLLKQWAAVQNHAKGFSDALKTGGNASQTFTQAMAKATGNSTSLNVALMLTGENANKTRQNIKDIAGATTEAGGNTKGWADIQKTLAQRLSEVKDGIGAVGIRIGTALLPVLTSMIEGFQSAASWVNQNKVVLGFVASIIGGMVAPMIAVKLATLAWAAGVRIAAAAQWLWNAAMDANPVMLIVMAIAALVAGVIYAYTHFKTFRVIVNDIGNFLKTVFLGALHGVETAAKALGSAFAWLWHTVLKPVFDVVGKAVEILARIFLVVFIGPIVLLVKDVLAPAFTWLWQHAIKPALDAIGAAFTWLWNNVIHPVFNFIGAVFHWIYDNVIHPVVDDIVKSIHVWAEIFNWIYGHVIKPVGGFIGDVVHGIAAGFSNAVKAIKGVWSTISDIVKKPIKWVIQYIYDDGIVPVWNALAGVFDKSWKIKPVNVSGWAGGGILPGYAPGVDSYPAMLSPGEAVLTPEAALMLGHSNILALNAMSGRTPGNAANGMPIHAAGGFLGDIGSWISGAAAKVWDGLKTAAGWISAGVSAVTGNVTALFSKIMGNGSKTPGQDNLVGRGMAMLPGDVLHMAIKKVKDWLGLNGGNGKFVAGAIPVGQHKAMIDAALMADGIPQGQWGRWEAGMNTLITRESGWNAAAINNWDSNAAAGHPSQGLTQTIPGTFESNRNPALPDNILDPVANIAASIRYILRDYGDISAVQQANASMPPKGYSAGGIVSSSRTFGPTTNNGGASIAINLNGDGRSDTNLAAEIERRLTFAMG